MSVRSPKSSQTEAPSHRQPHRGCLAWARQLRVSCDIGPQYGLISTVMIHAVSSGATWTLSLQNFLRTCKTQVRSTFATIYRLQFDKIYGR